MYDIWSLADKIRVQCDSRTEKQEGRNEGRKNASEDITGSGDDDVFQSDALGLLKHVYIAKI